MTCRSLGCQCLIEDVVLDCPNHRESKTTFLRTTLSCVSMSMFANERNSGELWKEEEKEGTIFLWRKLQIDTGQVQSLKWPQGEHLEDHLY